MAPARSHPQALPLLPRAPPLARTARGGRRCGAPAQPPRPRAASWVPRSCMGAGATVMARCPARLLANWGRRWNAATQRHRSGASEQQGSGTCDRNKLANALWPPRSAPFTSEPRGGRCDTGTPPGGGGASSPAPFSADQSELIALTPQRSAWFAAGRLIWRSSEPATGARRVLPQPLRLPSATPACWRARSAIQRPLPSPRQRAMRRACWRHAVHPLAPGAAAPRIAAAPPRPSPQPRPLPCPARSCSRARARCAALGVPAPAPRCCLGPRS